MNDLSGQRRSAVTVALCWLLLGLAAAATLGGTLLMPSSYSWYANYVSESAAQGVHNAWLTRLGFCLFGGAALWIATVSRPRWPAAVYYCQRAFALCLFGAAAFAHKPWLSNVPYDATEDLLHSVAATAMGFAFSISAILLAFRRTRIRAKILDIIAVAAAVGLSAAGGAWPASAGLTQRVMFVIAFAWYAHETWATQRAPGNVRAQG